MSLKIILLGDTHVGKTAITKQFCFNVYPPNIYKYGTIGIDFGYKNIVVDGKPTKIHIWDAAGNRQFERMTCGLLHKIDEPVFVCDLMNEMSIINVMDYWLNMVKENKKFKDIKKFYVLCNKNDLYIKCENIEYKKRIEKILDIINESGGIIECVSAMTNDNLYESFNKIFGTIYYNNINMLDIINTNENNVPNDLDDTRIAKAKSDIKKSKCVIC